MKRIIIVAAALVLALPAAAEANWFRGWFAPRGAYYGSYYYAQPQVVYYMPSAPVYAYPCVPQAITVAPVQPAQPAVGAYVTPSPQPPLAKPIAAPPSRSPEPSPATMPPATNPPPVTNPPPATNPPPTNPPLSVPPPPASNAEVSERRYYDAYAATGRDSRSPGERCSLGVWNLSNQDMVLVVEGQRISLPRGRSLNFDVPRQFAWQVEGRPMLSEQVPAGESAFEIVIRQ